MMAVTLMVVYIKNFTKQIELIKNYVLIKKNVAQNYASQVVIFFQNLIRIERLMLEYNSTH